MFDVEGSSGFNKYLFIAYENIVYRDQGSAFITAEDLSFVEMRWVTCEVTIVVAKAK